MSIEMKKKKILLASGCSYTDPNFKSDAYLLPDEQRSGWPLWPEIVGDQLDLEVVNIAASGKGNPWIAKGLISNIIKYGDRIEKVFVLWTSADRIQHYNYTVHPLLDAYGNEPMSTEHHKYCGLNELKWPPHLFKENRIVENWMRDSLLAMYTVATICEARGIDFVFAQGVNFHLYEMTRLTEAAVKNLNTDNPKEEYDNILENINQFDPLCYIELIEKGLFGGDEKYPIYKELKKKYKKNLLYNGYEIYEFESAFDFGFHRDRGVYRISDNKYYNASNDTDLVIEPYNVAKHDYHPNRQGQKYIADAFLQDHYKK
jgi:hypothetical protein